MLVAVSIVKSRQVSEVKRKKSSEATRVSGGRHVVEIGQRFPCSRGLAGGKQGGWGGGEGGGGHPRPSLPTSSREEWASKCYSHLWVRWVGRGKGGRETNRPPPPEVY